MQLLRVRKQWLRMPAEGKEAVKEAVAEDVPADKQDVGEGTVTEGAIAEDVPAEAPVAEEAARSEQ